MDISIITVGMNHLKYLKELMPSIFDSGSIISSFEVIYVDNCSRDGSVDYLSKNFPEVKIISNQSVKGFGENNNLGAQVAIGKYLAIINPDIILFKGSLDRLLSAAQSRPDGGIWVPKLLNKDRTLQHSVRRFITPKLFISRALAKGDDKKNVKGNSYYLCKDMNVEFSQFINWAVGAAYFVSKDLYNLLGGFDEDYFLYMEDEDLCLRSWKMDRPVVYLPEAVMIHNHMRSSKKFGTGMKHHFKSLFTFWKKHGCFLSDYASKAGPIKLNTLN